MEELKYTTIFSSTITQPTNLSKKEKLPYQLSTIFLLNQLVPQRIESLVWPFDINMFCLAYIILLYVACTNTVHAFWDNLIILTHSPIYQNTHILLQTVT